MFSKRLAILLMLLAVAACGRKEAPQPPPSKIPAPINDLSIQQRGEDILLTMTYPSVTLGGLAIDSLEAIEIHDMVRFLSSATEAGIDEEGDAEAEEPDTEAITEPALEPEETDEPETGLFTLPETVEGAAETESKESLVSVTGKDFAVLSNIAWSLEGSELDSAVMGNKVLMRLPLDESPAQTVEERVLIFGARVVAKGGKVSPFSNLVKLLPRVPPPPPTSFTAEATPQGVQLDWELGGEEIGFRVYRRRANVRDYAEPLASLSDATLGYLDRTAEFGRRYIYTVTSVSSRNPLVESAISTEHEIDYKDRFPPAPPREVVALAEPGRVRLLWEASASEDTRGYWIYRQDPGESFRAVNTELVLGSEYLDSDVGSGSTYRYYILAVDNRDNQSEASEEIEVRVP